MERAEPRCEGDQALRGGPHITGHVGVAQGADGTLVHRAQQAGQAGAGLEA